MIDRMSVERSSILKYSLNLMQSLEELTQEASKLFLLATDINTRMVRQTNGNFVSKEGVDVAMTKLNKAIVELNSLVASLAC